MMNYKINWDGANGVFAVPDSVADSLKLANGKAVKVLLYILKNKITDIDYNSIAAAVGVSDEDAEDAISFWQQVGVIYADGNKPVQVEKAVPSAPSVNPIEISSELAKEKATKMLSPAEIAERAENNEEIKFLFSAAEATLGKVLTYTEQRTIIWLYEYYGIAPDILMMIMDFAVSQSKATIGFIEKIATTWHDNGITTHEQAEREIRQLQNFYSLSGQVTSRLELNRTLTPTERKFVNEWALKNISIELIVLAYERTIDSIGKVKFSYMNSILIDWYNKGCAAPNDVKSLESKRAAAKSTPQKEAKKHSYDLDLLVAHAINNTPKIK
ncbi:MAG: DnaD domain protein [Oscillospiraceae bacterium]|nr:DnaD domain protein [Oscillospiraceae bacterium]